MSLKEIHHSPSLKNWGEVPRTQDGKKLPDDVVIACGWGRLLFGHTFRDPQLLVDTLLREQEPDRDIALYLRDPHVVLALAPQRLFLDPSHTYRLWLAGYRHATRPRCVEVRRVASQDDVSAMNRILAASGMVRVKPAFVWAQRHARALMHLVATDHRGNVVGTVTGVDHRLAFDDPENGSSLWSLAVDPQADVPGIGEALTRHLAEHYQARGRAFMDLSVLHDNEQAIGLYEKLGFQRVPVFCLKTKNAVNERLYTGPEQPPALNPYAKIIIDEAMRRGIAVEVLDEAQAYFRLSWGGRSILCRESLTELTTAVAMSRCQDKAVTRRVVMQRGLSVPDQIQAGSDERNASFLQRHERVVVKPANGEQGHGVTVDVRTPEDLQAAIARAGDGPVLIEQYVAGEDLRLVVIDHRVVAAAVRRPPEIVGTGDHSVRELIAKLSRRREAATGGESKIPLDDETERVVAGQGYGLDSVLENGKRLVVRKTANLHTGGTIHDVTDHVHRALCEAAVEASRALDIPVTGIDFVVQRVTEPDYWFIEANERPGLANHEPQPTAERFVDLLFPQTVLSSLEKQLA